MQTTAQAVHTELCHTERSEVSKNSCEEIFHYVQYDKEDANCVILGSVILTAGKDLKIIERLYSTAVLNHNPTFGTTAFWALRTHPSGVDLNCSPA